MKKTTYNWAEIWDWGIKDPQIYDVAFTHRSALNENSNLSEHNERLEFLGDAVLELIVTEYLFQHFPQLEEGVLTNLRASLVKRETLAKIAKELQLGTYLQIGKGEEQLGGRDKLSLLANVFEALLGAIYLDAGLNKAKQFVYEHLIPLLSEITSTGSYIDAKSHFQELAQSRFKITPHYQELSTRGPDHNKIFEVGAFLGNKECGRGYGPSKQSAQQEAARDALKKLGEK
ncbi:MAG TPA: ribonuclease III [Candidatus Gracilibacteria bacterium]|nr:ribonuclease III [Candidatus Gracilibacteria bacterium]